MTKGEERIASPAEAKQQAVELVLKSKMFVLVAVESTEEGVRTVGVVHVKANSEEKDSIQCIHALVTGLENVLHHLCRKLLEKLS